jgi:LysM repeat protein
MRKIQSGTPSWQTTLLLVIAVVMVVIIAILLAQVDSYQRRSAVPSSSLPVTDPEATVAAGELAVVYLPSEVSPTPTLAATPTQTSPAAEDITLAAPIEGINSTCDRAADGWSPYIVKAEDSLSSLARQFDLSVNTIMEANCLSREQVIAGQQIVLPQDQGSSPVAAECEAPSDWVQVILSSRDTLPKLARAHGTSVYRLMEANCLKSTNLMAGRIIFLPLVPPEGANPTADSPHPTSWTGDPIQPATPSFPIATPTNPTSH